MTTVLLRSSCMYALTNVPQIRFFRSFSTCLRMLEIIMKLNDIDLQCSICRTKGTAKSKSISCASRVPTGSKAVEVHSAKQTIRHQGEVASFGEAGNDGDKVGNAMSSGEDSVGTSPTGVSPMSFGAGTRLNEQPDITTPDFNRKASRTDSSNGANGDTTPMTPKGGPRSFKKHRPAKLPANTDSPSPASRCVQVTSGKLQVGEFEVTRDGASKEVWLLVNSRCDPSSSLLTSPIIYSNAPHDKQTNVFSGRMQFRDFVDDGYLGKGHHGTVRKVKHAPTHRYFAMKEIPIRPGDPKTSGSNIDPQLENVLLRELHMLHAHYSSDHIVKYYDAYFRDGELKITLEYMDHGSVADITERLGRGWPGQPLSAVAEQVAQGLHYMHSSNKIHRDIKPSNLLVNHKGIVKISDFGIAVVGDQEGEVGEPGGTLCYMSPERHEKKKHGPAADIWALGITLAQCALGGELPYNICTADGPFDVVQIIAAPLAFNPEVDLSPDFKELICQCAAKDPTQRPTAQAFFSSPFMVALNKNGPKAIIDFLASQGLDTQAPRPAPDS